MAIKIAQYRGKSWVSKLIRWQTFGKYSHTAIMLDDDVIIEAWQGSNSVRIITSLADGHTAGTEVDIYTIPCTLGKEAVIRSFLLAQVGREYDYWGILGFILRKNTSNLKKWFCSELFAAACFYAGIEFLKNVKSHQISPSMITRSPLPVFLKTIVI